MSSTFSLDLSAAQVGTALAENFVNLTGGISQMSVENGRPPLLVLQNESGFGLNVVIQGWGLTFQLPAGGWTDPIPLPVTATGLSVTPIYSITGGGVAKLLGTIYGQNDPIVPVRTLGNSPIGGTVNSVASNSVDNYLITPGVLSGISITQDISIQNQLDVTAGVAFILQPGNVLGAVTPAAAHFLTTVPSASYFLDLQPDGTYSWGLTHSGIANSLQLCTVTTNTSGNISAIFLNGSFGVLSLLDSMNATGTLQIARAGANVFIGGPITAVGGQATVGLLGVPGIVAGVYEQHVTSTATVTLITFTPTVNGLYRVSGFARVNNGTSGNNCKLQVTFFDPQKVGGTSDFSYMVGINGASGAGLQFGGATSIANNPYAFEPQVFDLTANKALTIAYTDPTNTPSDFLSVFVERLS